MTPSNNTGKMMTRRLESAGGTTLILTYKANEARSMRNLVQSIRIKGDKTPSLSLIARRSMQLYVDRMETARHSNPDAFASELAQLERMVTRVPAPAPHSKKQSPA